jgi:hypothetical protein
VITGGRGGIYGHSATYDGTPESDFYRDPITGRLYHESELRSDVLLEVSWREYNTRWRAKHWNSPGMTHVSGRNYDQFRVVSAGYAERRIEVDGRWTNEWVARDTFSDVWEDEDTEYDDGS